MNQAIWGTGHPSIMTLVTWSGPINWFASSTSVRLSSRGLRSFTRRLLVIPSMSINTAVGIRNTHGSCCKMQVRVCVCKLFLCKRQASISQVYMVWKCGICCWDHDNHPKIALHSGTIFQLQSPTDPSWSRVMCRTGPCPRLALTTFWRPPQDGSGSGWDNPWVLKFKLGSEMVHHPFDFRASGY